MTSNGVKHITSAPHHPASNGVVEHAVDNKQWSEESLKRYN